MDLITKDNMTEIIGRKLELEQIKAVIQSKEAQFSAVYGRRRVGKTFLIRKAFKSIGKFIEITGVRKAPIDDQIDRAMSVYEKSFSIADKLERPKNWKGFFGILTNRLEKTREPIVLFIDELPWLATPRSNLLAELDYFWNVRWSKRENTKVIICGSSSAWIIDKIINSKGGLYNRLTQSILLKPFLLAETEDYLNNKGVTLSRFEILELYMAFGGVPYYLNAINKGRSPAEIINSLMFLPNSLLQNEAQNLFESLFHKHQNHQLIVEALAKHRYGLDRDDLQQKIGIIGGSLVRHLEELSASGFISAYVPFGKKVQNIFYRLTDEFFLFHYYWIQSRNTKKIGLSRNFWFQQINTPRYNTWAGYAFESVCQKHYQQILDACGISGMAAEVSAWRYRPKSTETKNIRGAQIDLVIDRADRILNLCEIKFSKNELTLSKDFIEDIKKKEAIFQEITKTKRAVLPILIAVNGIRGSSSAQASMFSRIIKLDDLFRH